MDYTKHLENARMHAGQDWEQVARYLAIVLSSRDDEIRYLNSILEIYRRPEVPIYVGQPDQSPAPRAGLDP